MDAQFRGRIAHHAGDAAEQQVARHYRRRGYDVLARRWRGAAGEIDLILRDAATVVFVEVKKGPSIARAAERINARQMQRIMVSAQEFLADQPSGALTDMRFDAALVDAQGAFEIVENAFGGE